MTSSPLISAVVPSYNHAKYVGHAIQSIADQDYPNLEIILIDDGSTDNTAEMAENALQGCGRPYRFIRQENAGAPAALNQGIQMANGEYIAILNSDDRYLPGRLSTLFRALAAANRRFAYSRVSHVDTIGFPHSYQSHYLRQIEEAKRLPTINFELLRNNIAVSTGNFFFHRSLYDEVGGFAPYVTSHDWDFILRVLLVEEPLYVDELLLEYRIHDRGTLQKHLDMVNAETAQIMMDYLTHVGSAKNPQAPGPRQWGMIWDSFSDHYLTRFREFSKIRVQLDSMHSTDELPAQSGASEVFFGRVQVDDPMKPVIDLDLTQVAIEIPTPTKDPEIPNRLLFILPWMVMGGAERFTLNLMDQLIQRGWQVSIACTAPSDNSWKVEFAKRTDDIVILPDIVPIKEYPRYLRYFIELRNFAAILLQGSIEGYRLLPTLRSLFPHLPILDYLHFVTPDWMDGGFPRLSYLYRDAIDVSLASCEQVKRWMVAEGIDGTRVQVCPIGVDPSIWKPDSGARERIHNEKGISQDDVVMIYAARLEAQKQPLIFIETLRLLRDHNVRFRAFVAGDGSLRQEMEDKISQYDLSDRVDIFGAVSNEDMPAFLASGDLFFLPSQNEGISSAVYEAMSVGLPIIGADVGGQAELVTPECGILISAHSDADQPEIYARELYGLICHPSLRQQMGTASRERIMRGYTIDQMGECVDGLLARTIHLKKDNRLVPAGLSPEQHLVRDTQHVVEYLQARQEWRNINQKHLELMQQFDDLSKRYFDLLQPKPPSHWFYLWLRQLFLPVSNHLTKHKVQQAFKTIQTWLKRIWIKK